MIVAIAALLSAPRIASWRLVSRPFSLTTSTGPSSGTVSMCAQSRIVGAPSGPGMRASTLPAVRPGGRPRVVLLRLEPEAAQVLDQGVRHRALASRRALDLAEPDEVGEQPLALLRGGGVDHARERYRRRPALALPARDAAVHDVDHVVGAESLQQARADRGRAARTRRSPRSARSGVELLRQPRGCRGRACGPSPGCGPSSHSGQLARRRAPGTPSAPSRRPSGPCIAPSTARGRCTRWTRLPS